MKKRRVIFFLLSLIAGHSLFCQDQRRIYGKIFDLNGDPIAHVHIKLSASNTGTLSNSTGDFSLLVSNCASTILVSHVGYRPQSIQTDCGMKKFTIILEEGVTILHEVVVKALSASQVVRNTIDALESNFLIDSINYTLFSRITQQTEDEPIILQEYIVDLFSRNGVTNQFHIVKARSKAYNKEGDKIAKKSTNTMLTTTEPHLMLKYVDSFLKARKMKRYKYTFMDDIPHGNEFLYHVKVESIKKNYTVGGELLIDPISYGIVYLKSISEDENLGDDHYSDRMSESFFKEVNGKWILSHGFYSFIVTPIISKNKIYHNIVVAVTDTHESRQFKEKEKLRYYTERTKKYYEPFDDDFWESYNYIPLDSAFKSSLTHAKNP